MLRRSGEKSISAAADLHEPKGIESAAADTVYVADGSGSGSWESKLGGIINLNEYHLTQPINDISTANDSAFFYVPVQSELYRVNVILKNAITTANAVVSVYVNGVVLSETMTINYSGSTAGTSTVLNITAANTIPAGSVIEVRSNGASDTTAIGFTTISLRAK